MAIVPGYEYDLFVSYAHADDVLEEGEEGWVGQFVKRLVPALRQRLGGSEALKIFFDSRATSANYELTEVLTSIKQSALFLAVSSPSYATRDWPRQELETFVAQTRDSSRLFVVECLPVSEAEYLPPPLDSHFRLKFWKASGPRNIPMPYLPTTEAAEFQPLIHYLASDIRDKLLSLKNLPESRHGVRARRDLAVGGHAENPRSDGWDADSDVKRIVLLTQTTDDVEDEADQIRSCLKQYEETITLLPVMGYPQGGEAFKMAFGQDLAQAHLVIQLLGRRAGRLPPDLPEGYTRYQFEAARAGGIPIMQWRHPDLDVQAVADSVYRSLVAADTVVASGLEAFKRQILDWVRDSQRRPKRQPQARAATVFINADTSDMNVAREVERECLRHALTTVLPIVGASSEATRKDLEESLTDCDVLLFIYGETTPAWIRSQLRQFNKIRPQRQSDPKLLAIYNGPPREKPDIGVTFPNARVINCRDGWNVALIRELIAELPQ
jgi:hypothetical protein